jgi:hypothetical protein
LLTCLYANFRYQLPLVPSPREDVTVSFPSSVQNHVTGSESHVTSSREISQASQEVTQLMEEFRMHDVMGRANVSDRDRVDNSQKQNGATGRQDGAARPPRPLPPFPSSNQRLPPTWQRDQPEGQEAPPPAVSGSNGGKVDAMIRHNRQTLNG